jgi:hypothetical protein
LGKDDKPATYTVRLHLTGEPNDKPNQRVFDVLIQGKKVLEQVDVAAQADDSAVLSRVVKNVRVVDNLVIELVPKEKKPSSGQLPIVSGIEIERVESKSVGAN